MRTCCFYYKLLKILMILPNYLQIIHLNILILIIFLD
jgi:hypothetical protein